MGLSPSKLARDVSFGGKREGEMMQNVQSAMKCRSCEIAVESPVHWWLEPVFRTTSEAGTFTR